ncbi:hypothetical protein [Citrobacter amalonaticus]|uniref:hypothetical protein n=1 Tax=Citrobacter amalonaticus TaxID=35703 RepID=UPI003563CC17
MTNNKLTGELLGFYAAYSAWIKVGAPVGGIFKRSAGLCANAYDYFSAIGVDSGPYLEAMHAAFVVAGMDEKLPFNPSPEQYEQEQRSAECYLNPARLAWVAAELQERRKAGNSPVIPDGSEDTKRLDWLDAQNKRLNEYYGTLYGWKFDANFQRNAMMLNDSNYPVMTVRQAIDQAIAAVPKQETL